MQNPQNTLHLNFPPPEYPTTGDPLTNLSMIQSHLDSLCQTLSNSVNAKTPLTPHQSSMISSQLSSAILHVIINGASLITSSHNAPVKPSSDGQNLEIIELDVETLTADQSHVCEFCGKGFKRDANLRMHMRAHGDKFKTLESLAKPNTNYNNNISSMSSSFSRKIKFSCPYVGCERNKKHKSFKPLKSVICVKNHFKRFHCAKMFACTKCKCKSFSVLADMKRHMKNCSTTTTTTTAATTVTMMVELCSCGLKFGTKDELFRHVSMSEGHMPASFCGDDSNNFNINSNNNKIGVPLIEDEHDMRFWSSIEDLFNF